MRHPIITAWVDHARRVAGPAEVRDGHTHVGDTDPDGRHITAEAQAEAQQVAGNVGAVVMSNANPAGYDEANARIMTLPDRVWTGFVPFCRIDPNHDGPDAVERWVSQGAKGVKLHPRAERFALDDPGVGPVLAAAADAAVPVLVHAGRGIPPLGPAVVEHLAQLPALNLVLAHCAISDLDWLAPLAPDLPGLFVDTAWWDATDHVALFARFPVDRIVHASDTPYGWPDVALALTTRVAAAIGLDPEAMAAVLGDNLAALLRGERPQTRGTHHATAVDATLLRLHAKLHAAIAIGISGGDPAEAVDLALLAMRHRDRDEHVTALEATARAAATAEPRDRIELLLLAAHAALTPQVPVPAGLVDQPD